MQSPIFESHAMFVHKGIAIIKYDPNTIMCIVQCTLFQHIQIWVNIKNLNKFYRDIMICVVVVVFLATNVDYCCCLKHTNFKWFQRRWWFSLIFYGSTQAKKKHFPILIFGAHIAFECTTKNGIQSAKINFMFVKCTVYLRTEFRKKCKHTLRIAFARVFLVFALVPLLLWTLYIPMHCMHRCKSEKNG